MPSFPASPKCIVWIPFGLIDYCIWFGSSKASLMAAIRALSLGVSLRVTWSLKGSDAETVSWPSFIRLFKQSFFKMSFVSWIEFNYLVWQPPGWQMKALKTSRPVIGRILSAGWPARRANQPDHLQSCNRHRPDWLSQNEALALKLLASRGWPFEISSSTSWVLDEGRKFSQGLAFY